MTYVMKYYEIMYGFYSQWSVNELQTVFFQMGGISPSLRHYDDPRRWTQNVHPPKNEQNRLQIGT